ncbi:MAG: Hpt domain-containing protein [Candidatus Obscuribacterales bacterium]|nr:Hpt domain-containing protein [Candidatus Obscuribacterales bacterium]
MSAAVADLKTLEEELDEECARELAAAFLEDAAAAVSGIQAAISARNFEELKVHAHALKGCCRTIKAADAEQLSTELESAAINQSWPEVGNMLPKMAAAYNALCAFINSYLGK